MNRSRPLLVIAHRGESRDAPENTLAAVNLAWARGAEAVEIDARLSADNVLMVSHDPDTRRIGGPRRAIARQTVAELRTLDAGAWKHRRWTGERMPLLREMLDHVPRGRRLFVELKDGPASIPPLVADLAAAKLVPAQVLVMSFNLATVGAAARALPGHEICLLLQARDYLSRPALERSIARARELGCRSIDVEAHRKLTSAIITTAHAADLAVYAWTVNRVATARRLAAAGIDGLTTDRCAWLRAQLHTRKPASPRSAETG